MKRILTTAKTMTRIPQGLLRIGLRVTISDGIPILLQRLTLLIIGLISLVTVSRANLTIRAVPAGHGSNAAASVLILSVRWGNAKL